MLHPERNDVNITKLFAWSKEFEIENREGSTKYWARLLPDSSMNQARIYSLRRATEFRKKLRNPESDEYVAFIPDKGLLEKENLVELALLLKSNSILNNIEEDFDYPMPKEPKENATQEEQELYQAEIDAWEDGRSAAIRKQLLKVIGKEREKIADRPFDILYAEYAKEVEDDLCQKELIRAFRDACVYFGTYTDPELTTPFFHAIEDVLNLPEEVKNTFIQNYVSLELSTQQLKK